MKFMKLGSRPDAFYSSDGVRSISSEIRTDLIIQVNETRYLLHKFPLLSKCLKLQRDCCESHDFSQLQVIELPDFPGGSDAFELCVKFCYGITITLSAYNIVAARCAAKYLQMTEEVEKGNLVHKLEVFFKSCILKGWKDCIVTLQTTKPFHLWAEELGITSRCIESLVSKVCSNPTKVSISHSRSNKAGDIEEVQTTKKWWGEDLSELRIDLYWRTMAALKSGRKVPPNLIGDALVIYTSKWLPKISRNLENGSGLNSESDPSSSNSRMLLESIITLLPVENGAVSCSFLLKLLKAANILQASNSSKLELARRVALQLDKAKVCDLMIPSVSTDSDTIYDLDIFLNILEQFMLQSQHQNMLQSAENGDWEFDEGCRSSSSAVNGAMIKVAKLVDGYLQEIARDVNVPLSKFIALTEAVPQSARLNHDDLYKAIDIYLKSHPELKKSERKDLCQTLDCKKLSLEACMHAAQNELLPLRVVVQVLFSEQARAAMAGGHMTGLPNNVKALLAAKGTEPDPPSPLSTATSTPQPQGPWVQSRNPSVSSSRMKPDADESADGALKVKQNCLIPSLPKKSMLSKLWSTNRVENEK